jgi:AraC-like DNA-binding protein
MTRTAAFMHIPSPALGACMLAGVERDTRGCMLDDADRFNYYPATPMAVISWIFEGTLHMVEELEPSHQPTLGPALPCLVFSGPQRSPSVSWSPGAVHALSVGFYPEAFSRLIGRPIEPYLDQHLPLETVAPLPLLQACQSIIDAHDDDPFSILEAYFQPLWCEPGRPSQAPYLGDWVRSLATRTVHSTTGRSLRQLQRRVRHWTGQSYRDLQLFIRIEEAFIRRIEAHDGNVPNLAAIAADSGFADQSHMGREIRRVTGISPARFNERLANDEAFWYYRLIAGELGRSPVVPTKPIYQGPTRQSTRTLRDKAAQRR